MSEPTCPNCGTTVHCGGDARKANEPDGIYDYIHTPAHGGPECGWPVRLTADATIEFKPKEAVSCDFADAGVLGAEATADYCYAHQAFCKDDDHGR